MGIYVIQLVQAVYGHLESLLLPVLVHCQVIPAAGHVLHIDAAHQPCELLVLGAVMTQDLLHQDGPETGVLRHRAFVPPGDVGGDVFQSFQSGRILLEGVVAQVAAAAPGIRGIIDCRKVQEGGIPRLGIDQGIGESLVRSGAGAGIDPFHRHIIISPGLINNRHHASLPVAGPGERIEQHVVRHGCGDAVRLREAGVPQLRGRVCV